MPRFALASVTLVALIAILALATVAATDDRALAFSLSVGPGSVAAELRPGETACQRPIPVAEVFRRVRFRVGTFQRPGLPLTLSVRAEGRTLARGRLAGGYADGSEQVVSLDRFVQEGQRIAVCVRNAGENRLGLYGGSAAAARTRSGVTIDGEPTGTDLTLDFLRERPRSMLATIPAMAQRAEVFSAGWMAPWVFLLFGGLTLLVVPACVALALSAAVARDGRGEDGRV